MRTKVAARNLLAAQSSKKAALALARSTFCLIPMSTNLTILDRKSTAPPIRVNMDGAMAEDQNVDLLTLTADIVASHVANNNLSAAELPALIKTTYDALASLGTPTEESVPELKPAVPIRSSIKPDHLVCLEDGKKLAMLKRYLMTHYAMTPEQYRAKWKLPADYPMVAPNYAERRRELAKAIGLGNRSKKAVEAPKPRTRTLKPVFSEPELLDPPR